MKKTVAEHQPGGAPAAKPAAGGGRMSFIRKGTFLGACSVMIDSLLVLLWIVLVCHSSVPPVVGSLSVEYVCRWWLSEAGGLER